MKQKLKNLICIVVSLLMITQVSPISAIAAEVVENQSNTSYDSTTGIVIESEIESMRTENSKTYITDDGAYYQVSAAVPIHEESNSGEWEEIADIDENITTAQEAQNLVSELATFAITDNGNAGFSENETLQMYSNGEYDPMKIAGVSVTSTGTGTAYKSCIYVRPNIITKKSVFINHAELKLTTGTVDTTKNTNTIKAYRLRNDINTLGNVPLNTFDNVILDEKGATSNNDNCVIDITSYAHCSSLGVYENTGIALEPAFENTSIEVTNIVLSIYYREIGDIDKTIESESVELGRAGTLYVNDYTCSPIIVKNDLGIFDELEEVNIQTVINSAALDDDISDGITTRTNYYSVIQFATSEYYWKNCEGDYIHFINTTNNEYSGKDSSGDTYTLTCANNRKNYGLVSITNNKDNTKYSFVTINGKGYLSKIKDEYNNEINVSYDGTKISCVTDGSGRKYRFNYTDGMLSSISVHYISNGVESPVKINNQNISINYEYDENNRLQIVKYPDNYGIIYSYDSNNRIISVKSFANINDEINNNGELNINEQDVLKGLFLEYSNPSSNSNILESYTLTHKGQTIRQVDINAPSNSIRNRIFTNHTDGTEKIMQYDMNSNLVHFKDYNGQEYYIDYENNELKKLIYAETTTENLVKNGDFENGTSNWTIAESSQVTDCSKTGDASPNKVLKIMADNTLKTDNVQTIAVTPGKSYVLSCTALCVQSMPFNSDRYFSVKVTGSLSGTFIGETSFDYGITNNWQTSKSVIKIPSSVSKVKISINSLGMPGVCYFDDVSLYPVNDENTADVSNNAPISSDEIVRNEYGQITDIIHSRVGNNTLGKHYEYDNAHYKTLVEDEGKTTYYNYDCGSGLLLSKGKNSNAERNTQYVYSGIGSLTAVNQAITNVTGETINQHVEFAYDDDMISSIYHNGCLYEYIYNEKGQVENISVKESQEDDAKTDFSIAYDYCKDNVGSVIFGNGSSITYNYEGNNITQTIYDNGKTGDENKTYIYSYEYSDDGSIKKMTDEVSDTVTVYSENGSTITKNGKTVYSDNGKKMNLFGNSFTYSHSKATNNNITTITESSSASLAGPNVDTEVKLDGFNRIISSSITNKASLDINTHYRITDQIEYLSDDGLRESSLVTHYKTSIDKRKNRLSEIYNNTRLSEEWFYEYDDVGRITKVFKKSISNVSYSTENKTLYPSDKGDLVRYYEYDEAGQLKLEANLENSNAIGYSYDAGGNIAKKTSYYVSRNNYNYDTGEFSFTPSYGSTQTYSYKSNGMTDYLTSYNGSPIEYDKSGNPTKYSARAYKYIIRNIKTDVNDIKGEMTWNGNLLTSFVNSKNQRYEYTYDGDGHRTSKIFYEKEEYTIPKSIIEYIWEGDTLIGYRTRYYGYDLNSDKEAIPENYVLNWDKTIKLIYSDNKLVGASVVAGKNENTTTEFSQFFDWEQSGNYSFMRDGQGNITKIYDANEQVIVSMFYDAYGNMTQEYTGDFVKKMVDESSTSNSPFLKELIKSIITAMVIVYTNGMFLSVEQGFDGYIFDSETGLYYGQQRYYCPSWGRFLNASDPMTLTENISSIYNSNLFNYCGNDPVNNITKTGFNAPCTVISDAILPQITNNVTNLINENRSTAKTVGKISTSFDVLGLGLSTTNNSATKSYWDKALGKKANVVDSGYGLNYIQSAITKNTSSITKYSVEETNTPYKSAKSIN